MAALPTQEGWSWAYGEGLITIGLVLLALLIMGVLMLVEGIMDLLSGRRPWWAEAAEVGRGGICPDCGHPASYHKRSRCRGAAEHRIGFAQDGQTRCPCTLSRKAVKRHRRDYRPKHEL